jgi:hypothetical protein
MSKYNNTKLKGDIAEHSIQLKGLKKGWAVLKPIGDRLPYDLVFDINGKFVRIQIKSAWKAKKEKYYSYIVDSRITKTNRRVMKRTKYSSKDVDFVIAYIEETDESFIFPIKLWLSYKGPVSLSKNKRAKSKSCFENWQLIEKYVK